MAEYRLAGIAFASATQPIGLFLEFLRDLTEPVSHRVVGTHTGKP
jgi:hypothetical protein